ncbi:MAG: alpha/beta fold hydrolase [Chloroflexi bacterium]|nr:alpha/beta fold hydrolase [Chloroflexota bacterium]
MGVACRWMPLWLLVMCLLSACAATARVPPQTPYPPRAVREIVLRAPDGTRLVSTLYAPARIPAPAVLLLHVADGSRHDWEPFAARLREAGVAALALDLRGHGASGGQRDWERMTGDAATAYAFLRREPSIDPARIVLAGGSLGANIALALGAAEPSAHAVAMVSPGLNLYNYLAYKDVQGYGARPLFMICSEGDAFAVETQRQLAALATGPARALVRPGAAHGTALLADHDAAEALMTWIGEMVR